MTAMSTLFVGGSCAARELELGPGDFGGLAREHQVSDVGALVSGRAGAAVRLAALADLAGVAGDARFVHVESEDGSFTANVELRDALSGLIVYELDGDVLPRGQGGPFRLLFADAEDCSVNVKFLGRVEFLREPGSHTAKCASE